MLRKMTFALVFVLVALFAVSTSTFAQGLDPDWNTIQAIPRDPANVIIIDQNLTGYPTPSDTGPYAIGWSGGSKSSYCNTDRDFDFYNWVSIAQWMRIEAKDINKIVEIRKPGTYTITDKPMTVRIASNGDVLVTFQEIWGDGNWNARWYEYTFNPNGQPPTQWDKKYPQLANELTNQIPVDKKYKITIIGSVDGTEPTDWTDIPAGDGMIKFLNTEALHNLATPEVGFDMQLQEIVAPCNTTGDYVLRGRVIFQAFNQMWYIDPLTGQFDMTRDAAAIPPASYVHNPM